MRFEHAALPELHLDEIDLSADFLGRRMSAPFLISSMTGGPEKAKLINENLARAAGHLRIAFAVGSQRVAVEEGGVSGFGPELRELIGDMPLLSNFGAAQLRRADAADMAAAALWI